MQSAYVYINLLNIFANTIYVSSDSVEIFSTGTYQWHGNLMHTQPIVCGRMKGEKYYTAEMVSSVSNFMSCICQMPLTTECNACCNSSNARALRGTLTFLTLRGPTLSGQLKMTQSAQE